MDTMDTSNPAGRVFGGRLSGENKKVSTVGNVVSIVSIVSTPTREVRPTRPIRSHSPWPHGEAMLLKQNDLLESVWFLTRWSIRMR